MRVNLRWGETSQLSLFSISFKFLRHPYFLRHSCILHQHPCFTKYLDYKNQSLLYKVSKVTKFTPKMEVFVASIESQLELFTETVLDLDNKFIFGKILHYHRTHVKVQGLGVLPTSWMLMTWEDLKGPGTQKISRSPGGTQTAQVGVNSATLQLLFTCSTSKTHTYTFKVGLVGSYPQFMQERCMISLPCFPLKGFKFCLQISSFFPTFVTLALRFPWMLDPNILGGSKNPCWIT